MKLSLLIPAFLSWFLMVVNINYGQTSDVFFSDSNQDDYYDSGLAFPSAPSSLRQRGPSGDKIPTSTDFAYSGSNALELTWTSQVGGDWSALVIAPGFPFQDIANDDFLGFWAYSEEGLSGNELPLLYFEGAPANTKSTRFPLSAFVDSLPANSWVQVLVPLDTFINDPNQSVIDFSQTKAVIFGQNQADGESHTLYIDEVRSLTAAAVNDPVNPPTGFIATSYDSHIELAWDFAQPANRIGYHIYRSDDGGQSFRLQRFIESTDSLYIDFVGFGDTTSYQYRMAGVNGGSNESNFSPVQTAQTREFNEEEILEMVQRYTFRYFYDFAHPVSGLSRERNTSGNLVTIGGSGFGVMSLLVGIERGYISRAQGKQRLEKIVNFLSTADRFHGVWPHWMNGTTGEVIPFSTLDDGGDLVETSFMIQGLLTARQYFDQPEDSTLRQEITALWHGVEWNWYRRQVQKVLTWHWSPNNGWQINLSVRGFNETHIVYLLAIASPTNGIPPNLYDEGWAGGNYVNNRTFYGYPIIVGKDYGGPLFFAHYSYLGFDPRNKRDAYANYFLRNYNHTYINRFWCIQNPDGHQGYSDLVWGLTASDNPYGYLAHEPGPSNRDNGTISPTAALGSIPYAPEIVIPTLYHLYREYGDRIWGKMGFRDAFNLNEDWFAQSYLAIDQGPIILMIENYRTGLLWNNFMANPEIKTMMDAIGFVTDSAQVSVGRALSQEIQVFPNPAHDKIFLRPSTGGDIEIMLMDMNGRTIIQQRLRSPYEISIPSGLSKGMYNLRMKQNSKTIHKKLIISQ